MGLGIKTYIREHASYGLRLTTARWVDEWELFRLHSREIKKAKKFLQSLPLKLNLGCGPNWKEGWVNIDLYDARADLQLDLREPWPFPDNSVSYVYSEHVFEHFELHTEVPHFLGEALRVLKPEGMFDVVVPDSGPPLKAYGNRQASYWSTEAKRWHPKWCQTEMDHINYHFRQDGQHQYAWDAETLRNALQNAGFTAIKQRDFNPLLDTEDRRLGSLSMTASKPHADR